MTGSLAGSSHRSHAGAHPSCKICLKNAWMRPAGPLAAFHLCFLTQQLMIGILSCRRQGQLHGAPLCGAKSMESPPKWALWWLCGTQGWDRAPVSWISSVLGGGFPAGLRGTHRCGGAAGSGHRCHCSFWGPVVYYAAIRVSQYWWGIPVFQRV